METYSISETDRVQHWRLPRIREDGWPLARIPARWVALCPGSCPSALLPGKSHQGEFRGATHRARASVARSPGGITLGRVEGDYGDVGVFAGDGVLPSLTRFKFARDRSCYQWYKTLSYDVHHLFNITNFLDFIRKVPQFEVFAIPDTALPQLNFELEWETSWPVCAPFVCSHIFAITWR